MRRNWRAVAAAIGVLGLAAAILPATVGAQKVANPGTFKLEGESGFLQIGTTGKLPAMSLAPRALAQCIDGLDNDGDGRIDTADPQCVPGPNGEPDDSELAAGYQPKVDVSITGSIDGAGNVTIPKDNVVFPKVYRGVDGFSGHAVIEVVPTHDATGFIDPMTGEGELDVRFRVKISGTINGGALPSGCTIGTAASPIHLNLVTGRKEAVPGFDNAVTGTPYDPTQGTLTMVDNAWSVPRVTNCSLLDGILSEVVGLPTPRGHNKVVLGGRITPAIGEGINATFTPNRSLQGEAPFTVSFDARDSFVAKG